MDELRRFDLTLEFYLRISPEGGKNCNIVMCTCPKTSYDQRQAFQTFQNVTSTHLRSRVLWKHPPRISK